MIPFSPPDIYQEIIDEVTDTLKSGWITTGPKTKRFEKEISAYTGAKSTLCVNSATAGLELMLRWYGVGPGDEVIVPAYTYCASANVVIHVGAKPVLVDVGEDFNMDASKLRSLISERTKVIVPVDFAGFPCDYEQINQLVKEDSIRQVFKANSSVQEKLGRILVLADAAHSFGAIYKGKHTGSLCDASVFSFHAVKNLTTAEGGAVCLNMDDLDCDDVYQSLVVKSLHGQNKDALAKTQKGNWKYDIVEAGFKWNMTDIQAAMGLVALRNYDDRTMKRRKEIFDIYDNTLKDQDWAQLPLHHNADKASSCHLYPLRVKGITGDQRDQIIAAIFEKDVSVNVHFPPIPTLTAYKELNYRIEEYPICMDNYYREISLPVYYNLTDDMLKTVIDAVVSSVKEILFS